MLIYLIGMPGVGKTTLGQQLADKLKYKFIDLDNSIAKIEGSSVTTLFEKKGEEHFRMLEQDALGTTFERKNTIIATGGGTPCFVDNMDLMCAFGITIYLKATPEDILNNLSSEELKKRPLFKGADPIDKLTRLLEERKGIYENAEIILDIKEEDTLGSIIRLIKAK